MSSITHTSLDAFEQRARTGAVTTKVNADLQMIVALIKTAREARQALETIRDVEWNGYAWIGAMPCPSCGGDQPAHKPDCNLLATVTALEGALASVPA